MSNVTSTSPSPRSSTPANQSDAQLQAGAHPQTGALVEILDADADQRASLVDERARHADLLGNAPIISLSERVVAALPDTREPALSGSHIPSPSPSPSPDADLGSSPSPSPSPSPLPNVAGARDGLRPTNIRIPREVLDWAGEIHESAGGAGTPAIYVETSTGGLTFICGDTRQRLVLDEDEYEEALSAEGEGGGLPVFAFEWSEEPRSREEDALRKATDQARAAFLDLFYRADSVSSEDTLSTSTSSDTSSSSDDDVPPNWLRGAFGQGGRVSHNNANAHGSGNESSSEG